MKGLIRRTLRFYGYDIVPYSKEKKPMAWPPDMTEEEKDIYNTVKPFTMTSLERIVSLARATTYVVENGIEGDFVECGVWRGGSMMVVAHMLKRLGDTSRKLYLYDTFEGMVQPDEVDIKHDGSSAKSTYQSYAERQEGWCFADRKDVTTNILSTGYPEDKIVLVEGKVEDTIPGTLPSKISLLRLDTDWYESTKHELKHLYPNLTKKGVLIIDDYGDWQGARKAVDEYFNQFEIKPLLSRVDYTGRLLVKEEL